MRIADTSSSTTLSFPATISVVLLADVHEFEYKEIAGILEIPIGTVMSRINRARVHLRKSLGRIADEYGITRTEIAKTACA